MYSTPLLRNKSVEGQEREGRRNTSLPVYWSLIGRNASRSSTLFSRELHGLAPRLAVC